jgi:hypothetical protein
VTLSSEKHRVIAKIDLVESVAGPDPDAETMPQSSIANRQFC